MFCGIILYSQPCTRTKSSSLKVSINDISPDIKIFRKVRDENGLRMVQPPFFILKGQHRNSLLVPGEDLEPLSCSCFCHISTAFAGRSLQSWLKEVLHERAIVWVETVAHLRS